MIPIDVDEIAEVNYLHGPAGREGVEIRFRDGSARVYSGADLPAVLEALNHWTPPTA